MADIQLDGTTAMNAIKAALAGSKLTLSDTIISDVSPILEIEDTNAPLDRKRVYWFKNGASTVWRSVTDAGSKIRDWIDIDDDTGDMDFSEATSITMPATINPKAVATPIRFEGLVSAARRVINAQSGTSYTFALSDGGCIVTSTNSGATSFTVPAESSVDFPIGTQIDILVTGAGTLTIVEDTGVVVNTPRTLTLRAQHSVASLVKTTAAGAGTWQLFGDLLA